MSKPRGSVSPLLISAYASAARISSSLCLFFQAFEYLILALSPQESSLWVQLGNNFIPVTDLSWAGAKGRTDYRCCFGLAQLSLGLFRMKAARENVRIWDPSTLSSASRGIFLAGGAATCCVMVLKAEGTETLLWVSLTWKKLCVRALGLHKPLEQWDSVFIWALCRVWFCSKHLSALSFLFLSPLCGQWALLTYTHSGIMFCQLSVYPLPEKALRMLLMDVASAPWVSAPSTTCFAVLVTLPQLLWGERSSASLCPIPWENKRREWSLYFFFFET